MELFVPSSITSGTYPLTITAHDLYTDAGTTDNTGASIIIGTNTAPTFSGVFNDITQLAYYPFEVNITVSDFSDPEGDVLSFELTTNASWITTDDNLLTFTGENTNTEVGDYSINVR